MDREDYMRCSMELNDHFEGRSQISGAACLFASTAIKELLARAEKAERALDMLMEEEEKVPFDPFRMIKEEWAWSA